MYQYGAFSKQSEQSWLHKTSHVLHNENKKKRNLIGPTIKKFEDCIVERWILLSISFYDAFVCRYMVAFSKQCEQSWLQKTPNILS